MTVYVYVIAPSLGAARHPAAHPAAGALVGG
jgi:hypothetical protein